MKRTLSLFAINLLIFAPGCKKTDAPEPVVTTPPVVNTFPALLIPIIIPLLPPGQAVLNGTWPTYMTPLLKKVATIITCTKRMLLMEMRMMVTVIFRTEGRKIL
jgi:hypothetical protein